MLAYYGHRISPNQIETSEGYLVCRNVPIARTGEQLYLAGELGLAGDPDRLVRVYRPPEEVFAPQAVASFEGKPVTDGHPPEEVGPENYGAYARGHLQNVRREGALLVADLYITDPALASDIRHKVKREISCGYTCTYQAEGEGFWQRDIRGNHAAVVPKGRAGREVAIKDAAQEAEKGTLMSKFVKNILTVFGRAAKDAAPEELGELVDTAATALEAEPPTPSPGEREEAKTLDALGEKLDQLLELLKAKDQQPELPAEEEPQGLAALDQLAGELEEKDGEEPQEEAEDQPPCSPETRDAALRIIKRLRPAVAALSDQEERERVANALIGAVGEPDAMTGVLHAARDSARARAGEKPSFEETCARQEAAYAARNPHISQKEDK